MIARSTQSTGVKGQNIIPERLKIDQQVSVDSGVFEYGDFEAIGSLNV